ncbi:uncharacterized protein [Oscarella lobularis]|uniref:uncharacterized protein n=1 Tax=Oscarella lobularis TaxID=121494 RepID=UPI003313C155
MGFVPVASFIAAALVVALVRATATRGASASIAHPLPTPTSRIVSPPSQNASSTSFQSSSSPITPSNVIASTIASNASRSVVTPTSVFPTTYRTAIPVTLPAGIMNETADATLPTTYSEIVVASTPDVVATSTTFVRPPVASSSSSAPSLRPSPTIVSSPSPTLVGKTELRSDLVVWVPVVAIGAALILLLFVVSCVCWHRDRRSDRYDFSVVNYYAGQELKSPAPATTKYI